MIDKLWRIFLSAFYGFFSNRLSTSAAAIAFYTMFALGPIMIFSIAIAEPFVGKLMAEFEARGARLYVPRGDRDYAIHVGLRMLTLRHLVEERESMFAAVPDERLLLAYYANSVAHLRGR